MRFNYNKLTIVFFFLVYVGLYFIGSISNYLRPINIAELIVFSIISALCFLGIYKTSYSEKISYKLKGNIQIVIVIILAMLVFFNPINFSNYYNIYVNRYLSVVIIVLYLLLLIAIGNKLKIDYWLAIIILLPYLVQSILINIFNMISMYINFPYINLFLTLTGFVIYKNFIKK